MHGAPNGQIVPQAPQLRLLLSRSTHALPHKVCPAAVLQPAVHAPLTHIWFGGHRSAHPPQFRGSICVSVQTRPHRVSALLQAHWPLTQFEPNAQGVLHAPQLFGSALTSTHEPWQLVSAPPASVLHESAHVPFTQTLPGGHTSPQAPQLLGSLCVSAHCPAHRIPPLAHWHVPAWQVVPAVHWVSQAPQLELSVCKSTHPRPHADCPAGQMHFPPIQSLLAPHALPQAPQLFASPIRSVHFPKQNAGC